MEGMRLGAPIKALGKQEKVHLECGFDDGLTDS